MSVRVRVMKVGAFDAGDAGNIEQGGKCDGGKRKERGRGGKYG
jgi:hypothetical protein